MITWSASAVALIGLLLESGSFAGFSVLFSFSPPSRPSPLPQLDSLFYICGRARINIYRAFISAGHCVCDLCLLSHSTFKNQNETNQCGKYYSSYFADEIGAQRGSKACSKLHNQKSAGPGGDLPLLPLFPLPDVCVLSLISSPCGSQHCRPRAAPL